MKSYKELVVENEMLADRVQELSTLIYLYELKEEEVDEAIEALQKISEKGLDKYEQ